MRGTPPTNPPQTYLSPPLFHEQKCYLYTLRAASKWGRWDVIESLMKDMRELRVGTVDANSSTPKNNTTNATVERNGDRGAAGGDGGGVRSRVLGPDCYAPLVEAYAQASMWARAIEAFQEGFVVGLAGVEPVNYRVRGNAQRYFNATTTANEKTGAKAI